MATLEDMLRLHRIERFELVGWIDRQWVRPRLTAEGYVFDRLDEARLMLIVELRRDFACDDEMLALVLSLLDQLYAARRLLRSVEDAVEALPGDVRAELRAHLRAPASWDDERGSGR